MIDASLVQSVMTVISTLAAGVSAKAALDAVRETRASGAESRDRNRIAEGQRKAMIRPHVVVYLRPGRTHNDFRVVTLFVHNVGPGAARAVELHLIRGADYQMPSGHPLQEWGAFQAGVNVLPPDDAITTTFFLQGKGGLPDIDVLIEVRYRDIEGQEYEAERFQLNLDFLKMTLGPTKTTSSDDPLQRIARSLEGMAKRQ
ncbi:hypothetical protein HNQ07_004705 [Deinococcus metalli]|uniref:DUF11 domain-containing protein n=1 Tax=Deinococcus metalli TaxID=1141878 RepID=A0A7W8NSP9_9DEIO|nr:hypothetical protein [Deinococcus metalli]MBB5379190.1 hypothetical protein [Deinococcus metalli]GHF65239.1 hypothetical protein GCM10017781_46220 [Deinococcus metalli]